MKINTFIEGIPIKSPRFIEKIEEITDIWSNSACVGYCIAAMKNAGMNREQIQKAVCCLISEFDEMTISEAEQIYRYF